MEHLRRVRRVQSKWSHAKNRFVIRWSVVGLVMFGLLGFAPQAESRRSLRKVHETWEMLLGNNLVLAYYNLGLIGDLFRAKVYTSSKAHTQLRMVLQTLREDTALVKQLKPLGSRTRKDFFRKLKSTMHILYMGGLTLQKAILYKSPKRMKQFLIYRNAVFKDINRVIKHPGLRKKQSYRGGWKVGRRCLGHFLGVDMAFGYQTIGLIADGYFQKTWNARRAISQLDIVMGLFKASALGTNRIKSMLHPKDQRYVAYVRQGLRYLYMEANTLKKFMKTRNRLFLKRYLKYRRLSWGYVRPLAR